MHTQIQAIKENDCVDVVGYVQYLRKQRCLMVQTEVHFKLLRIFKLEQSYLFTCNFTLFVTG